MTNGNTGLRAAGDGAPCLPTEAVSAIVTRATANIAIMFGRLRRTSIGRIGAVSMGSAGSTGLGGGELN